MVKKEERVVSDSKMFQSFSLFLLCFVVSFFKMKKAIRKSSAETENVFLMAGWILPESILRFTLSKLESGCHMELLHAAA